MTEQTPTQVPAHFLVLLRRFVGNDPDALPKMRNQIATDLATTRAQGERLQQELTAIDELLDYIEQEGVSSEQLRVPDLPPPPQPLMTTKAPSLKTAILRVLRSHEDPLSAESILDELGRLGWAPGGKAPRN